MARLTTFSKLLITILILLGVFFAFQYFTTGSLLPDRSQQTADGGYTAGNQAPTKANTNNGKRPIRIGVVTWGGYAGGQYFNEGFTASSQSRFKKEYGLDVEFIVNDDPTQSLQAWKNDEIDLHWYTIDAYPTLMPELARYEPVVLWQADWSRGGDAIVVRRGINTVADLKGKRIAVAELTPSHSFLLWLLDAGGLQPSDVQIVSQPSAVEAAAAFKAEQVDAAVVWSPDDELSVRAVAGAKILESTRSASNIIADIFFAKKSFVNANQDALQKLYEGWMKGAAEINSSSTAKQKAAQILGREMGLTQDDALAMIGNVRLTTHGDNQNFFEQNASFKGITGGQLYRRMAKQYQDLGVIAGSVPAFRSVSYANFVNNASATLSGSEHQAEAGPNFTAVTESEGATKEAIATKRVSINFPTGVSTLDDEAKRVIDLEFVPIARAFGNARIRIEGNTDNVGSKQSNIELSKKRAQSVAAYLTREYAMDTDRFIVIGNGPDKPISNNSTPSGRALNRRTDFELVRD